MKARIKTWGKGKSTQVIFVYSTIINHHNITDNTNLVSELYMRKQGTYTENKIYPFADLSDLRSDLFAKVRKLASNQRVNHPWQQMNDLELLKSAGLYLKDLQSGKEGITLAGIFINTTRYILVLSLHLLKGMYLKQLFRCFLKPPTKLPTKLPIKLINKSIGSLSFVKYPEAGMNAVIKDYMHPYELLIEDFEEYYGDKIIESEAAHLLIKLDLGAYSASRRLLVPLGLSFKALHEIIQIAFDWKDRHLHDFNIFDEKGNCILNIISEFDEVFELRQDCPVLRDKEVLTDEYIRNKYRMVYTYDYGDDWKHEISVQGIISDFDKNYPVCIMADGNRPPEDVGGIPGYEEYLAIISNPDDPEYKNVKRWAER